MKGISRIICLAVVLAIVSFSFVSAEMVNVDIKPKHCPNTLTVASQGTISVAILGTETFDVKNIDPTTVFLVEGLAPLVVGREEVAVLVVPNGDPCACVVDTMDGFLDLNMKFSIQELVTALETKLGRELVDREVLTVNLTAMTYDGVALEGSDCLTIIKSKAYGVSDGETK